jgi:hypothetical protein
MLRPPQLLQRQFGSRTYDGTAVGHRITECRLFRHPTEPLRYRALECLQGWLLILPEGHLSAK